MSSDVRSNIFNAEIWLRLLFVVLFWFLLTLIGWVLGAVVLVQFLIVLITGEKNGQLSSFGSRLGIYLKDIVTFMCFSSDEKPFPFSDFPDDNTSD